MTRYLGVDFGLKRVGLAITDEAKIIASPFQVLQNDRTIADRIANLCREYSVERIVVGMPFTDEGSTITEHIENFAKGVRDATGIETVFQDETLTTAEATRTLREMGYNEKKIKEVVDKYSAQRILADYLEGLR